MADQYRMLRINCTNNRFAPAMKESQVIAITNTLAPHATEALVRGLLYDSGVVSDFERAQSWVDWMFLGGYLEVKDNGHHRCR